MQTESSFLSPFSARVPRLLAWLARGFDARWQTIALIFVINTAWSVMLSLEDTRPYIHSFLQVQFSSFGIAYFVNCFQPWTAPTPVRTLALAVAIGTLVGVAASVAIKVMIGLYDLRHVLESWVALVGMLLTIGFNGFMVSLFFVVQLRESHNRTALAQAEVERHSLTKQAVEAELKLMQAQIEPHFLFNTLSNVQFLTETNPPAASQMLDHLIQYLRAAIPQLRSNSTTLGQEARLAESYLSILKMRMGKRLTFRIDIPPELGEREFPPMMLLSLIENSIKHGLDPVAEGGDIQVHGERIGNIIRLIVADTGNGLSDAPGNGVGLANIRDRLRALYGRDAKLTLQDNIPRGVIATIEIPVSEHESKHA